MSNAKRYYWLKLKKDFFTDKRIKKLRKIAGGDTYTIIYLKMQLLSLQDEGILYYDMIEDSFEEEIALQIDEDVEDVRITIGFLIHTELLIKIDNNSYELVEAKKCIGSETDSAERVRKHRENKTKMLHCNANVTKCNTEIEIEKEKDIEKENIKRKVFKKPTLEEIDNYVKEKNMNVNSKTFYDYFETSDWIDSKGNKVKNWKQKLITWNSYNKKDTNIPGWFNESNENKEITEAEKEELEKILNDMEN